MPTVYRSTDAGAPPMVGCPGGLVNVLDACLVHGYGVLATGTLTSDNNNVVAGDTVTIGSVTYTFRAAVSAVNDVLIGANADASLLNLINTINLTGSVGTTYVSAQQGHPEVCAATTVQAHSILMTSSRPGTLGNSVVTTKTAASLSWGAATMTGGSAAAKASLGWTKDYSALARAIYRAPAAAGATRCYYEFIDNTPDPANGAFNTRVQGLETVTALGSGIALSSGTGPFAHTSTTHVCKSNDPKGIPQRPWILVGDDRTAYLFIMNGVLGAGGYFFYGFGDIRSLVSGDVAKGFIFAGVTYSPQGTQYNAEYGGQLGAGVISGHFLERNWSGVIQNVAMGKQGDGGFRGSSAFSGQMQLPHGPDGGMYLSPIYVFEGSSPIVVQRGLMRGLFQPLHVFSNFTDGDTFSGVGDLAGRTFMFIRGVSSGGSGSVNGAVVIETTAWAP